MTPADRLDIGDDLPPDIDAPLSPWEINRILYGRSMPKAIASSNCGDAAGGFQAGNTCAKGGGRPDATRSAAFKAWFGDWGANPKGASKVVDRDGRPMTVYHGATQHFHEFNGGAIFFTDNPEVAGSFAKNRAEFAGEDDPAPRTIPAYLSIKNPFVIDANGKPAGEIQFSRGDMTGYRKALASDKYDGIIIKNTSDEGNLFIAKRSSQVKSAIGNRGTFDSASDRITYGRSTPLSRHPVTGQLVSSNNKSGSGECSTAASQWRTGKTNESTFKTLAKCRAMAAAHGKAGNLRAAGKEGHAQVLEHRAKSGKVGVGNRKALASKLKADRAKKAAVTQHPEQPEVEASRKSGHENIGKTPDLRAAVAKHRLNKGSRSDRLDNLANQASAHHEMIALSEGANSKAYQSAIKRAIRIKRAADKERPELSPKDAAMVRKGNDERFDEAMATTPKRVIKLKATSPLHKAAREAVGSALESRSAAEEANRVPGLDPEKKGRYFSIAEKRYREAQGPLKALRREQGKLATKSPAASPVAAHTPSSEQSPGHPSRDVPDEPTSEGLMAKGYREIGPNARAKAGKVAAPAPASTPALPSVHLPTFAANVHSAATSVPSSRRFGGDKAFIHDVHEAYQKRHGTMDRGTFNGHLLDANRSGHLELSRADMVEAMKPGDVKASDTHHPMGGTFNFVRVKGGQGQAANPPKPSPAPAHPSSLSDNELLHRYADVAEKHGGENRSDILAGHLVTTNDAMRGHQHIIDEAKNRGLIESIPSSYGDGGISGYRTTSKGNRIGREAGGAPNISSATRPAPAKAPVAAPTPSSLADQLAQLRATRGERMPGLNQDSTQAQAAKMSPERAPVKSPATHPKTPDDRRSQIDRLIGETAAHTERLHGLKGRMLDAITRANVSEGIKSPNAASHRLEAERAKADHAAASERLQNHLGRIEQLTHGLNSNARRLDKANTVEERREGFVPGTGRAKVSKPAAKTPTPAIPAPAPPPPPSIDWKAMVRDAEAAQRQRDAEVLKTARATGALPHGKGAVYKAARKLGDRTYAAIINADATTHLPMYKDSSGNYTKSSVRNLARRQRELLVEKLRDSASRRQG